MAAVHKLLNYARLCEVSRWVPERCPTRMPDDHRGETRTSRGYAMSCGSLALSRSATTAKHRSVVNHPRA